MLYNVIIETEYLSSYNKIVGADNPDEALVKARRLFREEGIPWKSSKVLKVIKAKDEEMGCGAG